MVASLLKIVSTGMQDERLQPPKGQPNLDSFLMVIIKAGRYATNWSRIDFDTKPDFGSKAIIRLPTKGEMIGRVYLVTVMPDIRSQQQVAYYTRKPIQLANSNYSSINMYDSNGKYVDSVTIIYQPTAQPYGRSKFEGVQLDDLIVGGVYSLTYTVPSGSFALLVTTRALNTPQFDLLNSDTFTLFGAGYYQRNESIPVLLASLYSGQSFQKSVVPLNISSGPINDIAYNNNIYLACGNLVIDNGQVIIENNISQAVSLTGTGKPRKFVYNSIISYNGARYVGVGAWTTGSMIWSNDGITWSDPVWPTGVSSGEGNSVVWMATIGMWIAVGSWGPFGSQGIKCTSTDGINWSTPSFIPSPLKISGQEALNVYIELMRLDAQNPGSLSVWSVANNRSMPDTGSSGFANNVNNVDNYMHSEEDSKILQLASSINSVSMTPLATNISALSTFNNTANSKVNFIKTQYEDMVNALIPTPGFFNTLLERLDIYYDELLPLINTEVLNVKINDLNSAIQSIIYSAALASYIEFLGFIQEYMTGLIQAMSNFNMVASNFISSLNAALELDPQGEILTAMGTDSWTQPFPEFSNPIPLSSIWIIEFENAHPFLNGDEVTLLNFTTYDENGEYPFPDTSTITSVTNKSITITRSGMFSIVSLASDADVIATAELSSISITSCVPHESFPNRWVLSGSSLPGRLIVGDSITLTGFPLMQSEFNDTHEVQAIGASSISIDVVVPKVPPTVTPGYVGKVASDLAVSELSSSDWTITFAQAHPFILGDSVILSGFPTVFNGSWLVTEVILVGLDKMKIRVTGTEVSGPPVLELLTPLVSIPIADLYLSSVNPLLEPNNIWSVITNVSRTFAIGDNVTLSGFSPSAINGAWTIASVDSLLSKFIITGTTIANVPPTITIPGVLGANISRSMTPISAKIPNSTTWRFFLGTGAQKFSTTPENTILNKVILVGFQPQSGGFNGEHTLTSTDYSTITITTDNLSYPTTIGVIQLKNGNIWNSAHNLYEDTPSPLGPIAGLVTRYTELGIASDYVKNSLNFLSPYLTLLNAFIVLLGDLGSKLNLITEYTNLDLISSGVAKCITVNESNVLIGGTFKASGMWPEYAGSILYSPDGGISWSQPTDPGGKWQINGFTLANDIAWTGSLWVAAGNWLTKSISFSEDGETWLAAINPINISSGTGTSIALNGLEMIIGGQFDSGFYPYRSLTKASGTSLGFTWGTIIRPTDIDTNRVSIFNIAYYKDTTNPNSTPVYLLLGQWADSDGLGLGAISVSNDGISWSESIIPNDPTLTESFAYGAATNGTKWIVVGSFAEAGQKGANSITISDNIGGLTWELPLGPFSTPGIGFGIIYSDPLFIAVGNWDTGYITISINNGGAWTEPANLNGKIGETTGAEPEPILVIISGYATSISKTAIANKYIIAGNFYYIPDGASDLVTYSLLTLDISSAGVITNVIMINTDDPLFVAKSVAWNGQSANQARYVAVGANSALGSFVYSTDLVTWNGPFSPLDPYETPISGYGNSVAWNGAQFAATGSWQNGGIVITSSDGITWIQPVSPPNTLDNIGSAILWNGITWLVTGTFKNTQAIEVGNIISFSSGINFTVPTNPLLTTGSLSMNVNVEWIPSESKWIATGKWNSTPSFAYISKSSDGLEWSTYNLTGIDIIEDANISIINNNIYILGNVKYYNIMILSSVDGTTWQSIVIQINQSFTYGLAWNGSIWIAVGSYFTDVLDNLKVGTSIISVDGQTWSSPMGPPIPQTNRVNEILSLPAAKLGIDYTGQLHSVGWNGKLFVAVGSYILDIGQSGTSIMFGIGQIATSPDGINWTIREIESITALNNSQVDNIAYGIAWNGSIWVAVGAWDGIKYQGKLIRTTITTSVDGINWTTPISPPNILDEGNYIGYDVAWNGFIWVAVGRWGTGIISTSTDGIIWSDAINPFPNIRPYDPSILKSIKWNGTKFIAVGYIEASDIDLTMTSTDGLQWSYTPNTDYNNFTFNMNAVASKRSLPFTLPQTFDPNLQVNSYPSSPGNYQLTWLRDPVYGTGSQFVNNSQVQQPITQTFTATQRTQWLTFGSYYNSSQPIVMSLNKVSPEDPEFVTDLVGPKFGWTNNLGHSIVDTTTLTIGGNLVETLSGQLMEVIDEFQTPLEKVSEKNRQLCRSDNGFNQTTYGYSNVNQTLTTHLPFWFSRGDPGCALPIDALNVDEVRVTVNFKPVTSLYYTDSRAITPILNAEGGSLQPMQGSPFYYEDTSGSLMPHIEPNRLYNKTLLPFPKLNMTSQLAIQDSYLLVEYIYLDKAEANRFRIADIQVPIVQHYIANPVDNRSTPYTRINLDVPNPTRDLFFFCQRYEAPSFNAHFLATRDLYRGTNPYGLWWPDASGLDARLYGNLRPGFSTSGSEPIRWLSLNYNESLTRYSTENVAVFRSLLPSIEQRKAPWLNRYYYNLPFGYQNGLNPISAPLGEANMDKIKRVTLSLGFHGPTGDPTDVYSERFFTRVFAETYNILRIYGGRATTMFAY